MRISDWSSDVCSSDLCGGRQSEYREKSRPPDCQGRDFRSGLQGDARSRAADHRRRRVQGDRKSVVQGKRVTVRVDLGGRRIIKKTTSNEMRVTILSTHVMNER